MVFLKAILEKISRKIQGIRGKYSIYWVVSDSETIRSRLFGVRWTTK